MHWVDIHTLEESGQNGRVSMPADDVQIDRHTAIERIVLAPNSWVEIIPGFVRDASAMFTELHDTLPWHQTEVLRYDHYVPERRLGVGVDADLVPVLRQTGSPSAVEVSCAVHRVSRRSSIETARTSKGCTAIVRCAGSTTR